LRNLSAISPCLPIAWRRGGWEKSHALLLEHGSWPNFGGRPYAWAAKSSSQMVGELNKPEAEVANLWQAMGTIAEGIRSSGANLDDYRFIISLKHYLAFYPWAYIPQANRILRDGILVKIGPLPPSSPRIVQFVGILDKPRPTQDEQGKLGKQGKPGKLGKQGKQDEQDE